MEFRETLLAAQRNQQQKSSESGYYKARFDPPKKEQRSKDRLSANIQKFLAKKDEEEKQKKLEAQRKREELLAMRDPKALRKIQKTLKVIKSANKAVILDAVDREHTAVTRAGPDQPDQDDYGYESQEAAALYEKMMQKYSKIPDEPKFPVANKTVKKDLNGTIERVKHALQHEDDPVPHKRRRKTATDDRELSPPPKTENDRKKDDKSDKPKFRKPAPPPMDFNQLLKLAEQKKSEPVEVALKKPKVETAPEPDRLMTKKQKREYEEEMARRQRRQERILAEQSRKIQKDDKPAEREKKPEAGLGRIPKLTDKLNNKNDIARSGDRDRYERERADKAHKGKERVKEKVLSEKEKVDRERERIDRERLERLKAERDRIEKEMERLNKDRERLDKCKSKLEAKTVDRSKLPVDRSKSISSTKDPVRQDAKKIIDLKSQNTYRIDKNSNEKKVGSVNRSGDRGMNGHSTAKLGLKPVLQKDKALASKQEGSPRTNGQVKPVNGKLPDKSVAAKRVDGRSSGAGPSKPTISNSFDFDKHVNSLGRRQFPPGDVRRKGPPNDRPPKPKRRVQSDSEYDSEMDDFIDDRDEETDYSKHIQEIFGYDKSKYRYMDDEDDPSMESSFVQQQREEYISKKQGIMEDLEDMRLEAMMKAKTKGKKKRRISDD